MSVSKSSFLAAAFTGSVIWIAGAANPLAAAEASKTIAPPAVRFEAANACRIVSPTFAPSAPRESVSKARYPGGGRLSFPVAAPCPARIAAFDI